MLLGNGLRLLCGFGVLSGSVYAQCYDLTSVQLYELKGRFQERWNKPIWDAKPGEGNFHLDESPWMGGLPEFIIFTIGQVQKTGSGWVPLRKSRVPETWCRESPDRNSIHFCYTAPYQTPPPDARRVSVLEYDQETWSLGRDGLLRYTHRTYGDSSIDPGNHDFGGAFEAVIDLNTGAYSTAEHGHSNGHYKKRIPEGVELWRDTSLSAKVKLVPQACPAAVRKAGLVSGGELREEEAHPVPICAARAKEGSQPPFEFIMNPRSLSSPEGCVVAHEGPMPQSPLNVAKAQKR
jgi:hypothetical protein